MRPIYECPENNVSAKSADDCAEVSTLQSYHYSAVKLLCHPGARMCDPAGQILNMIKHDHRRVCEKQMDSIGETYLHAKSCCGLCILTLFMSLLMLL